MSRYLRIMLVSMCLVVLSQQFITEQANAATYYVSLTGSDSSSGSSTGPFRTIQHAAGITNPGDTVIVMDGTYSAGGASFGTIISRSGSSGSPITFKAQNKWGATLTGASHSAIGTTAGVHDIVIQDFEISNNAVAAFWGSNGDGSYNITIYRNKIHDNGGNGIFIGSDNHDYIIDSNIIYSCGTNTPMDHGIYSRGYHQTIMNNFIYNILHGYQIQVGLGTPTVSQSAESGDTFNIINNSFGPNTSSASHANICFDSNTMSPTYQFKNVLIQGNLSYGGTTGLVRVFYNNDFNNNIVLNNNLWYGTSWSGWVSSGYTTPTMYTLSRNISGMNPMLVDPANLNYHLQSSSPAINAGIAFAGRTYDADGNLVMSTTPDIGAYEYSGGTTPSTPPTGSSADTTAPSTPAGLSAAVVSSSQINVAWTPSTDNVGIAGYKVYRSGTQIATTATTSYSNTGLAASTTYSYTVATYDTAGNTSAQSAPVSAKTLAATDTTSPSVPTGLTAKAASPSQVNLSWTASTDNVGVAGYRIYRGGTQIANTTGTTYYNTGLTASTTYSYTVAAYDAAGNVSAQSARVSATTSTTSTTPASVIVDNGTAGTSYGGTWSVSAAPNFYGSNSLAVSRASTTATSPTYTWSATLPKAGTYDVYAWWTNYTGPTTRSTAAPYTITYSGGSQTVKVNQTMNGGKWNKLGTFTFGTSGRVTLTAIDVYPITTSADAVMFVAH